WWGSTLKMGSSLGHCATTWVALLNDGDAEVAISIPTKRCDTSPTLAEHSWSPMILSGQLRSQTWNQLNQSDCGVSVKRTCQRWIRLSDWWVPEKPPAMVPRRHACWFKKRAKWGSPYCPEAPMASTRKLITRPLKRQSQVLPPLLSLLVGWTGYILPVIWGCFAKSSRRDY